MHIKEVLTIILTGIFFLTSGFFIGKFFTESARSISVVTKELPAPVPTNTVNTGREEVAYEPSLKEIMEEYHPYKLVEERVLNPLNDKTTNYDINIGLVHEIRNISDQERGLYYTIYRLGNGDVPPEYSSGRLFFSAIHFPQNAPMNYLGFFDTEITEIEPLGDDTINSDGSLTIFCSNDSAIAKYDCEYKMQLDLENKKLHVKKIQ